MCGIVGFITSETKVGEVARAKFVQQGLIVDTLRGDDSSGVYGVFHESLKDDDVHAPYWCKQVADGYQFVNDDAYTKNFFDVSPYRAVVGHNRAATVGAVDVDGAHPFVVGPITLVHNGTLSRTSNLPTPMHKLDDVTVDSHAIACNLAEHSVAEVVESLDGAFTLIWHDSRDDSLNVIRNSKRPLHLCAAKNQDTIFFASEGPMLDFLTKRIGIDAGPIYYPKEGQHLKWLPDTPMTSPKVTELDLYADDWGNWSSTSSAGGYDRTGYQTGFWDRLLGKWVEYGSDADWKSKKGKGASCSGNVSVLPQDNRVHVGGRRKDIPDLLQEVLMEYDLIVEDRILMTPKVDVTNDMSKGTMRVFGQLKDGMKAVLLSVGVGNRQHLTRAWCVRPVAIFLRPSGEPTVIVKLVSVYGHLEETSSKTYDLDESGEELKYRGAFGNVWGHTDFMEQIQDGCGFCGFEIDAADHEELTWINYGEVPLCKACSIADEKEIEE